MYIEQENRKPCTPKVTVLQSHMKSRNQLVILRCDLRAVNSTLCYPPRDVAYGTRTRAIRLALAGE